MVVYVAPLGAGSGIPELKSYLNGVRVPGFLAINSFFVKAIGIAFSLAGGLVCGKQGPMIHAGAILAAGMSQAASSRFSWRWNTSLFRVFRTEAWKRDFTAVGAAVGVAVAFGSPMGAWMWVYEDAATHWNWDLGIITLGACLVGSTVVRILNFLAKGIPANGFDDFLLNDIGKLAPLQGSTFFLKDAPVYLIIGLVGGVAGALLPLINKYITLFRYDHVKQPRRRLFESALIAITTAFFRIAIPYIANDCQPINSTLAEVLKSAKDFSRFRCEEGEFSPWATAIYNPSDTVVRSLLFAEGAGNFSAAAVGVAVVFYLVFIIWTYGVAVPAGVFFPGFLLGSVYGRLIGIAVQAIFPSRTDVSLGGFAFVGAVSALAGFTRTISVSVIALEAVGGYTGAFAAVFVSVIAKLTSDFLYRQGIYDLHIDLKGIPFLLNAIPQLESYVRLRVSDVMQSKVIGVRRWSRISALVRMLATNEHHSFPVFLKLTPRTSTSPLDIPDVGGASAKLAQTANDSSDSLLASQLDQREAHEIDKMVPPSVIITPGHVGLQATIFDEGKTQSVTLTEKKEVLNYKRFDNRRGPAESFVNDVPAKRSKDDDDSRDTSSASFQGYPRKSPSAESEVPEFELMGSIDRGTLVALIKYECDRHEREAGEIEVDQSQISRENLDSAWPNSALVKNKNESVVINRAKELKLLHIVIDLKPHIDPDPLLMSDRAMPSTAYVLFRRTGARHILVANMRGGRVCGIMTRKDVLPESITQALSRMDRMDELKVA
ncbi:voltage gated chloride channel protein [Gracilaria domingensis]|nr:voltage gated chloride channel protein [Gracilaria domingensis]